MEKTEQKQLSAEDWEVAALEAIAEGGLKAVAAEPLARKLGVTKGSFYWHFKSVDALLTAALKHWEEANTGAMVEGLSQIADPRQRLRAVFRFAGSEGVKRALLLQLIGATEHPIAGPVIERVTRQRLEFLADTYRIMGLSAEAARHQAELLYSAYLGVMHLARIPSAGLGTPEARAAYLEHVLTQLVDRARA